jgi:Fe-S cluster assembly protein SufD
MTGALTAQSLVTAFDRRSVRAADPAWLREERRAAMARFAEQGLPTPRHEDWKYTSIAPLAATAFDLTADGMSSAVSAETIAPFLLGEASRVRLVFVDGRYVAPLSRVDRLRGVQVMSLAEAILSQEEPARSYLAETAEDRVSAFAALNAAFWEDGGTWWSSSARARRR